MKRIRSGSGLGDNLYLLAVVEHLVGQGKNLQVCTSYPKLFSHLSVETGVFSRSNIQVLAHYSKRKEENTNQWEDICIEAGTPGIPLRIHWETRKTPLVDEVKAQSEGRPVVLIHGGRTPMERKDAFGKELLPDGEAFNGVLETINETCFTVGIGDSPLIYGLSTHKNLNRQTDVLDLLDLASICDGIYGQCSFIVPLAEAFAKPLLVIWSAKGLNADHRYVSRIIPKKILSRETSRHVMDNNIDNETVAWFVSSVSRKSKNAFAEKPLPLSAAAPAA